MMKIVLLFVLVAIAYSVGGFKPERLSNLGSEVTEKLTG